MVSDSASFSLPTILGLSRRMMYKNLGSEFVIKRLPIYQSCIFVLFMHLKMFSSSEICSAETMEDKDLKEDS